MQYNPQKPYKENIVDLIRETWETPYVSVKEGTYPVVKKKFSFPEMDHTDGIGTKGVYHWKRGTMREAVLDALAMNLNDLAVAGAVPYKLQNHITLPREDERVMEVVYALVEECKKRSIAITGGEISFHDNFPGIEISITVSGFFPRRKNHSAWPHQNVFKAGDLLLGVPSSGLHANGFTKIREVFAENEMRAEFTEPTKIYFDTLSDLADDTEIHGMVHLTGGAYTRIKRVIEGQDALIRRHHPIPPHHIFWELHARGVTDEEMYSTFNCGVGILFSVAPRDVVRILAEFEGAEIIGEVAPGTGKVKIESYFSDTEVIF